MEAYFYILYSEILKRYYSGVTTLEANERFDNHINKVYGKNNFTQKADDWILFLSVPCQDFSQGRKLELHVKNMKSAKFIEKMKKYHELVDKLLMKF